MLQKFYENQSVRDEIAEIIISRQVQSCFMLFLNVVNLASRN